MSARVTTFLAILVSAIWALSMVVDALQPTYDPPAGIHGALMLVLGGIFGARLVGKSES